MALAPEEAVVAHRHAAGDVGQLVAQATLGAERAVGILLQREEAGLVGFVLGQEGFVADDVEDAVEILNAAGALPTTAIGLDQLETPFEALVVEGGADAAVLFEFEVAVVRLAGADANLLEDAAAGLHLAAQVDAVLDDGEARRFLFLAHRGRVADGDAVQAVIMAVRHAQIAGVGDDRCAGTRSPRLRRRIGQAVPQRGRGGEVDGFVGILWQADLAERGGTGGGGEDVAAAGAQVVRLEVRSVGVQHDVLGDRDVTRSTARPLGRRRAVRGDPVQTIAVFGHGARNARVDDVDDAADRGRSEQQGGRAAQHLDPLGEQRIDDDGMVDAGVADVDRADTVG